MQSKEGAEITHQVWKVAHGPGREEVMGAHLHRITYSQSFDSARTLAEPQGA